MSSPVESAPRTRLYLSYATVSIVWGSTYLAIRVGVLEMPPFWMAGMRLLIAGLILITYALLKGHRLPKDIRTWGWLILSGVLILGIALGGMFWAEQYLDSGLAAFMACMSPLMMALYGSIGSEGDRLSPKILFGLVVGLAGVAILIDPQWTTVAGRNSFIAVLVIAIGSHAWSGGSVMAKRTLKDVPPLISSAIHSMAGAFFLLLLDLLIRGGSWPHAPARAWWSLGYLIVFGSVIAYSAYIYLITHMAPAKAGTFTYFNPVIAVILGWLVLHETITLRILLGGSVILLGLFIVRRSKLKPRSISIKAQEPLA